ncbi:hypothetical protein [Halosimplex pelagicum]|uniref:Uncharacterized protein n=1 Tax=Halosimplex pelagicum TaxID=869886 RepID=A0A7D5PDE9_9EURY|nr:hypothetical protein [Halosimplex pelagicum]QLH83398.1 hypothetical protein HZS54_17945 [Halosimplex pelagicum]
MIEVLILVALAGGVALLMSRTYPSATKTWFRRIMTFRSILGSIGGFALGLVFLGTGVDFLVLTGFAIMVYSTLYVLYENPFAEVRKWIPI